MGIKRRTPTPEEIEAFGNAADETPVQAQPVATAPTPEPATPAVRSDPRPAAAPRRATPRAGGAAPNTVWPGGVARSVTIRYPDPSIPQLLAQVAELADRSQHNVAVRALRRGLEDLLNEAGGLTT